LTKQIKVDIFSIDSNVIKEKRNEDRKMASPLSWYFCKDHKENPKVSGWTTEAKASRKWGVRGKIVAHHDSHGLSYTVRHYNGTIGYYDPSELKVVK